MRYKIKYKTFTLTISEPTQVMNALSGPEEMAAYLKPIFDALDADQEHFIMIALNVKLKATSHKVVASGGMNSAVVDPRIVFRSALLAGAHSIVIAHNHPSEALEPSHQDDALTQKLTEAGKLLNIPILDHIIIAGDKHYSYSRHGRI